MRFKGHNLLAIAVAALAIYGLEYLLYGLAISPAQFRAMSGLSETQQGDMSRLPFGVLMPILAAVGLSLVIKWRAAIGPAAGAGVAVLMAVLFGFGSRLYGYVYGPDTEVYLAVDFARYIVTYGVAGAILGAWK
ncbi:MAG: hypothetical protein AB7L65_09295 [Hyphomonadaceae bacterium]